MTFEKKYKKIICPLCVDLAYSQQFNEIPVCVKESPNFLNCEDCPIDWEKLVI
jgi:hypothetical protein